MFMPSWRRLSPSSQVNNGNDDQLPFDFDHTADAFAVYCRAVNPVTPQSAWAAVFHDLAVTDDVPDIEDIDLALNHPLLGMRGPGDVALVLQALDPR
jgi:hypothetical protein